MFFSESEFEIFMIFTARDRHVHDEGGENICNTAVIYGKSVAVFNGDENSFVEIQTKNNSTEGACRSQSSYY